MFALIAMSFPVLYQQCVEYRRDMICHEEIRRLSAFSAHQQHVEHPPDRSNRSPRRTAFIFAAFFIRETYCRYVDDVRVS
jgi:hypothetical protein